MGGEGRLRDSTTGGGREGGDFRARQRSQMHGTTPIPRRAVLARDFLTAAVRTEGQGFGFSFLFMEVF